MLTFVCSGAHDGVRLAAARLTVREDGAVVAGPGVLQHAQPQVSEHPHLHVGGHSRLLAIYVLIRDTIRYGYHNSLCD